MATTTSRRAAYEQARKRRSIAVATVSSLIVVTAIVLLVPQMPRWERVRQSFFNGERFRDSFPRLLDAFVLDVKIFAWSAPLILILAMLVAMARNSRSPALFPLRALTIAYTDIMRGVPIILWIYLIGFGVPGLGLDRPWNSPLLWGSVALILTYASYVAEVFRAGIESVHESQRAAARSLGLSNWQTMRFVVIPQAIRRVVPPLMNDLVSLQKDLSALSAPSKFFVRPALSNQSSPTSRHSLAPPSSSSASPFHSHAQPITSWSVSVAARQELECDDHQTFTSRCQQGICRTHRSSRCQP
jgi:polar amino acid transport system permease protein